MNNKMQVYAAFTLAFGTASMSVSAATIPTFPMTIMAGVTTYDGNGSATNVVSGSWFAADTNGNSLIADTEKTALSQGYLGLVIGSTTSPSASHAGAPIAGDTNAIPHPGPSLALPARITLLFPSRAARPQAWISVAGPSPGMAFLPFPWAAARGAQDSAMGSPISSGTMWAL
ncbi:MAG: hypothetical protein ACYCZR_03215 [Burkholderiales bacterium]